MLIATLLNFMIMFLIMKLLMIKKKLETIIMAQLQFLKQVLNLFIIFMFNLMKQFLLNLLVPIRRPKVFYQACIHF